MTAPERPHDASSSEIAQARDEVRFVDVINTLSAYDEAVLMDRLLNPLLRGHPAEDVFAVLREALGNAIAVRLTSLKS